MQFDSDFRFDMDDGFSMCSQSMSCPSTTTSFSSASSAYEAFTPNTSRRSTPNELSFDLDGAFSANQNVEITPPSNSVAKYFPGPMKQEPEYFSASVKQESDHMGFDSLPLTPMKKFDGLPSEYDLFPMNMPGQTPMGTITPSRSFGMATITPEAAMGPQSYMMTPSRSLSGGSEVAESSSSWSIPAESPISFFQQPRELSFDDMQALEMERHSQSPMGQFQLHQQQCPPSPNSYRVQRKMMLHEAQRKTSELQRAQIRASQRKRAAAVAAGKPEPSVDVVRRSMCKCDYPGCTKAFRRNEHLKRHKQTFHGEGPNRFCCEFCGKDQFNRQDNLNNHRKLHARPNSRNRGVEYMPEAVPVIEHEERSRKKRAPPKSKTAKVEADFEM